MQNKFSTVALCSTSNEERIISIAKQCLEVLMSQKINVLIDKNLSKLKSSRSLVANENDIINNSDLVIAIGGDGTMLNSSRKYGSRNVPILGINLGNLGFLADINPADLTSSLLEIIEGKYRKDSRSFLEASVKGRKKRLLALNEVVIHSGAIAQLMEFELFVDNSFVYRQRADGLIVSSSTGSTAYSLSGGGPIIHPEVDALVLLPMLPQSLAASPLLVKDKSKILINLLNKQKAHLSFDSHDSLILTGNNQITISKANSTLNLIHPLNHDFFEACRNKLGWSS